MRIRQDILRAARDLITDPEHWCQYAAARNDGGQSVSADSPQATKFCVLGAMYRFCDGKARDALADWDIWVALDVASRELYGSLTMATNDELGHDAILAVMDKALQDTRDWSEPYGQIINGAA